MCPHWVTSPAHAAKHPDSSGSGLQEWWRWDNSQARTQLVWKEKEVETLNSIILYGCRTSNSTVWSSGRASSAIVSGWGRRNQTSCHTPPRGANGFHGQVQPLPPEVWRKSELGARKWQFKIKPVRGINVCIHGGRAVLCNLWCIQSDTMPLVPSVKKHSGQTLPSNSAMRWLQGSKKPCGDEANCSWGWGEGKPCQYSSALLPPPLAKIDSQKRNFGHVCLKSI